MPIDLLMPMGGRGQRFGDGGETLPKPLIELAGKPFFWWAAQSVLRHVPVGRLVFVVLREHITGHRIDEVLHSCYPEARLVVLDEVLNGPVLTCLRGMEAVRPGAGVLVNDCDHLFISREYEAFLSSDLARQPVDGALLTFDSSDPAYSYVRFGVGGRVEGAAEKQVVSRRAICGAYYFRNRDCFADAASAYRAHRGEGELFISGLYSEMASQGKHIACLAADAHLPFGTPEEYTAACASPLLAAFEEGGPC